MHEICTKFMKKDFDEVGKILKEMENFNQSDKSLKTYTLYYCKIKTKNGQLMHYDTDATGLHKKVILRSSNGLHRTRDTI